MRRRDFLALAGATATWPLPVIVRAQQARPMKRIGFLLTTMQDDSQTTIHLDAAWEGLGKQGWSERNLAADYRYFANTPATAMVLAAELLGLKPDVLYSQATPPTAALAALTKTIPIAFAYVNGTTINPLVQNYSHPGGNLTGFVYTPDSEIYGKNINLLRELRPGVTRLALIYGPDSAVGGEAAFLSGWSGLALKQNLQLVPYPVRTPADIADAVQAIARDPTLGLIVNGDAFVGSNRSVALAEVGKFKMPAVWGSTQGFTADGGLVGYASDQIPIFRGAGEYAGLILNGSNPADLPIQVGQAALSVNLRTAKAFGITIPLSILARADQVIE